MVKGKHDATLVDRKPKPIPNPMDPLTRQLAVVEVINEKLDRVIKILKERKGAWQSKRLLVRERLSPNTCARVTVDNSTAK